MRNSESKIKCPECGHDIDVNDILYHQLQEKAEQKYSKKYEDDKQKIRAEKEALKKEREEFGDKLETEINKAVRKEKASIEKKIRTKVQEEQDDIIKSLQIELNEKSKEARETKKIKIENEKLKRDKDELRSTIELEYQEKINETLAEEKKKIQIAEENRSKLKNAEQEQVIKQLNEKLKEAQQKAEQGSMQIQGEAQELVIEEWLGENFSLDSVEEIKKGHNGADTLQIIHTRTRQNCGSIYYESKRAKNFSQDWIEKFKNDIKDKNADIGVLVTKTMPPKMDRLGQIDGIWICTFEEFKSLCFVLREQIIKVSSAVSSQENRGEKTAMLYNYLTSNEFRLQVEAIVGGFTQMKSDLESEQRSMKKIWSQRQKQIDKVLINTTEMYGSIKGIAGNAIQSVPLLELPTTEDDEE